jgi:cellulose synthase/poly-beta-1,6-N-acetylglucosamine synthase-like glycosyltransferase
MTVILVPRGTPQTKPKACNVGLFFARGDYLVIYDAEDRPDPDQLKKAVVARCGGWAAGTRST